MHLSTHPPLVLGSCGVAHQRVLAGAAHVAHRALPRRTGAQELKPFRLACRRDNKHRYLASRHNTRVWQGGWAFSCSLPALQCPQPQSARPAQQQAAVLRTSLGRFRCCRLAGKPACCVAAGLGGTQGVLLMLCHTLCMALHEGGHGNLISTASAETLAQHWQRTWEQPIALRATNASGSGSPNTVPHNRHQQGTAHLHRVPVKVGRAVDACEPAGAALVAVLRDLGLQGGSNALQR